MNSKRAIIVGKAQDLLNAMCNYKKVGACNGCTLTYDGQCLLDILNDCDIFDEEE